MSKYKSVSGWKNKKAVLFGLQSLDACLQNKTPDMSAVHSIHALLSAFNLR